MRAKKPGTLLLCFIGGGWLMGCPAPECQFYNDCPEGQYCSLDQECVAFSVNPDPDPDPEPDVGVDLDGGVTDGGTSTAIEGQVNSQWAVPWIVRDPRPGQNRLLFPRIQGVNVDALRSLSLDTGTIPVTDVYDFTSDITPTGCQLDNIDFEIDPPATYTGDEVWLSCMNGGLRVAYATGDNLQIGTLAVETAPFPLGLQVVSSGAPANFTNSPRRFQAERGGSGLISIQLRSNDPKNVPRSRDIINASFNSIVQMWQLPLNSTYQSETVLVFDRGSTDPDNPAPPQLFPLQRVHNTDVWGPTALNLPVAELSAEVAAVVLIADVDANGASTAGVRNVMTIEPANGRVVFYAYNQVGLIQINEVVYESNAGYRKANPDPSRRLLLEPTVDGAAVVYAHPEIPRIWRLPFDLITISGVLRATLPPASYPSGAVPVSNDVAWVAVPTQQVLFRVQMSAQN